MKRNNFGLIMNENNFNVVNKQKYWIQYAISITMSLNWFATGLQGAWVGPTLLKLIDSSATVKITEIQIGLLVTAIFLGSIPAVLITPLLADYLGRKTVTLISQIFNIISFAIVYLGNDFQMFFIAQIIGGYSMYTCFITVPMYISEIASPAIRGQLTLFTGICIGAGNIYTFAVIPPISIQLNALINVCIIGVIIFVTFFVPESPFFLIMHQKRAQAERNLIKIRQKDNVLDELNELEKVSINHKENKSSKIDILKCSNLHNLFIVLALKIIQQIQGMIPLLAYCALVIDCITNSVIDPYLMAIALMTVFTACTMLSSYAIDTWGRRPLLLFGTFGTVLAHISVALYFYFQHEQFIFVDTISWLPMSGLIAIAIFYGIALLTIPFMYISETFSTKLRSTAASIAEIFGAVFGILAAFGFQFAFYQLGRHWCFFIFAILNFFGGIFIIFFVKETKGKNLVENE